MVKDENDIFAHPESEKPAREERKGLVGLIQGHANEFMISMAIHAAVLFFVSLIPVKKAVEQEKTTMIIESAAPEVKEEVKQIVTDVKVQEKPVEVVDDNSEVVEKEVNVENPVETTSISEVADTVQENAVLAGTSDNANSPPAILGVGEGNPGANGGLPYGYKSRSKQGKMGAMRKHGGAGTESAVDLALRWLAEHQEYDGSWDCVKYEGKWQWKEAPTGIALLAFLGAGYSENIGPFKKTVRKGVAWLNQATEEKKDKPFFGSNYASAIALMALSEASIFGSKSMTKVNANRIAQMFVDQYTGTAWRYNDGNDQDQSVSGWIALSLKSAKAADLDALHTDKAKTVFEQYKNWVVMMTPDEAGTGKYTAKDNGGGAHMTWVGMFQRQFLGFPKNDTYLLKATDNSMKWIDANTWVGADKLGDCYGIYYGTLATFQQQGVIWKAWNVKMKDSLLKTQRKGDPKLLGGSWDLTPGITAEHGGRVMVTSLMCLCLEIYYRYEMMN